MSKRTHDTNGQIKKSKLKRFHMRLRAFYGSDLYRSMTRTEITVWNVLLTHADIETGICWPSVRTIAAVIGLDMRNVSRMLRSLEAKGVLKRIKSIHRSTTRVLVPVTIPCPDEEPDVVPTYDNHVVPTYDNHVVPTYDGTPNRTSKGTPTRSGSALQGGQSRANKRKRSTRTSTGPRWWTGEEQQALVHITRRFADFPLAKAEAAMHECADLHGKAMARQVLRAVREVVTHDWCMEQRLDTPVGFVLSRFKQGKVPRTDERRDSGPHLNGSYGDLVRSLAARL